MIKKFKLFEAQQRQYKRGGTLFSNKHRSPNLPAGCAMIDIDNVAIEGSSIVAIIEDKGIFDSATLGNPMAGEGTWQRQKLQDICQTLKCPLILHETETGTVVKFDNQGQTERLESLQGYNVLPTDNRIFVEIRYGKPKSIMFRTDGTKVVDLSNDPSFNVALELTMKLNTARNRVSLYLVNDVMNDGKIYIRKYFPLSEEEKKNPVSLTINPDDPSSWQSTYRTLGLL